MPFEFPNEVESLDAVPEAYRALYSEQDGRHVLDGDLAMKLTVGPSLKKALDNERRAAREAQKQIDAWKAIGKTPEEIADLIAAQDDLETRKAEGKGEWDKLKQQLMDQHAKVLKAKDDAVAAANGKIDALNKTLQSHLIDAQATAAIAAAKGSAKVLLPHVQRFAKVVEEAGEYKVQVLDDKGDPRINGKGDPMTIADLVAEMRNDDDYARNFEGTGKSGSGSPNNAGGGHSGKAIKRAEFDKLDEASKRTRIKEGYAIVD